MFLVLLGLFVVFLAWVLEGPLWGLGTLVVVLLGVNGFHLYYAMRLKHWVGNPMDTPLPDGFGFWGNVFAALRRRVRKRAEERRTVEEALESFRRAVHAFPDGIIIFNEHGQIQWVNATAARYFQLDPVVDKGQVLTNLIRHPDFVTYIQGADFSLPLLFPNPRSVGQTLLVQVVSYAAGENLLLSRDVSDQERLDVMRRDFVANVSHELKTPLTVVVGFAEMLSDPDLSPEPEQVQMYVTMIAEQTRRMQSLIEDLLTLSALESASSIHQEEVVDLEPLLKNLHQEGEVLSGGRHQISVTIEGPCLLRGNAQELRSAFGNLLANAIRYTQEGGDICMNWRRCPEGGELSVVDTGIGIGPEHIPRLTERFYRVDRGRSRDTGGTGLGLAIVKHVLNRHQATLEVESELGKGTRFTARFPLVRLWDAAEDAQAQS